MNFVFRADASIDIVSGCVMRCFWRIVYV